MKQIMEIRNEKGLYEAPSIIVVEVKQESVICTSTGVQDYGWNDYIEE